MAQIFKTKQLLLLIGFLMATTTSVWADDDENYEFVETFDEVSYVSGGSAITCNATGTWARTGSITIDFNNHYIDIATQNNSGSITTPILTGLPQYAVLTFKAQGFKGGEVIYVTGKNCEISQGSFEEMPSTTWKECSAYIYVSEPGNNSTITFSCTASNRVSIDDVKIIYGATKVNISNAKYATFCYDKALDFSSTSITAYTAKAESNKVVLTEIKDGIVPANTGVILYGDPVENEQIPFTTTDKQDVGTNELVGINTEAMISKTDGNFTNYILSNGIEGVGFYLAKEEGAMLRANRAYLHTTKTVNARALTFEFDDTTTGISATLNNEEETTSNHEIYNLNGMRVTHPTKGLYIVRSAQGRVHGKNVKKVIIK